MSSLILTCGIQKHLVVAFRAWLRQASIIAVLNVITDTDSVNESAWLFTVLSRRDASQTRADLATSHAPTMGASRGVIGPH